MSSRVNCEGIVTVPVMSLVYSDMAETTGRSILEDLSPRMEHRSDVQTTESDIAERIEHARAEARQQTEDRLRREHEAQVQSVRGAIATALTGFEEQKTEYFARAEAEVVTLALSIAAKILHREAQVDPMLVSALVRMTMEKMREGSTMTVRVSGGRGSGWKQYFHERSNLSQVEVVEDVTLSSQDCVLETELGVTNFGLDTQLKEIEKGFFDLLALRPASR